jgi:hypothetical protein
MRLDVELILKYDRPKKGKSTGTLTATVGEDSFVDQVNLSRDVVRARIANKLTQRWPALKSDEIKANPDQMAAQAASGGHKSPGDGNVPSSQATANSSGCRELLEKTPQDIRDEAETMLNDPMLIKQVIDDVAALGVAGERELIATIYLVGVSRLLDQPLAARVHGPSSSGKSYAIEKTSELFPPEAVIRATQMTPQALFHMPPGALVHKFIVAGERSRGKDDETAQATRALREMISSGKLTKLMPMKVDGGIETVRIEQEGPIAFVESTTLMKVFDEDENRCIMLHTDEQPIQTKRILTKLAVRYSGADLKTRTDRLIQRHYALQRMLKPLCVGVPYAQRLAEMLKGDRVEMRRAFPQLVGMIKSVALLYQRQRQTSADGRLVATADDYELSRHLLVGPMRRLFGGGPSDGARRFYDRLATWANTSFTATEAKGRETNCKSSVHGWLSELHEAGLVEIVEPGRGRCPAKWRLTDAKPNECSSIGLPTVEQIFEVSTWKHGHNPELVIAS